MHIHESRRPSPERPWQDSICAPTYSRLVYPRHKVLVDEFIAKGEVIGIGPFTDRGNMAIFRTRAVAEEFVRRDPFGLEGLVKSFVIREWQDSMLT